MRSEAARARAGNTLEGRPIVIELIGTPGSGKTTLSRSLVEMLREQGIEAATIVEAARPRARRTLPGRFVAWVAPGRIGNAVLWWLFYLYGSGQAVAFAFERPALARQVRRSQRGRPVSTHMKRHILYWWAQLAGRYRLLTRGVNGRSVLVIDDGFLHRSAALHASHLEDPDPSAIAAYVDLLPPPDLVIRPMAGPDVCEGRVHDRGIWAHSRSLRRDEIARSLRNAEHAVDLAVRRARMRGWNVVEIDNGERDLELVELDLHAAAGGLFPPGASGTYREAVAR
jgi:hypothetical protein